MARTHTESLNGDYVWSPVHMEVVHVKVSMANKPTRAAVHDMCFQLFVRLWSSLLAFLPRDRDRRLVNYGQW